MNVLGELALWIALFLAVWGSGASFTGWRIGRPELVESGQRAILAVAPVLVLAVLGIVAATVRHDFSLAYVVAHTSSNTPRVYSLNVLWAGPEGSLLWWACVASICAALAVSTADRGDRVSLGRFTGLLSATLAVPLGIICFGANPYDRIEWVPAEGAGLAPHLQNPLVAPHFVALHGAYAAAIVPLAAVFSDRGGGRRWPALAERWSLIAWCLLTAGIGLGMRWRYVEPVPGQSWVWSPALAASIALWIIGALIGRAAAVRRRSMAGMYVVYAGLGVTLVGIAAQRLWHDEPVRLQPGQGTELRDPLGARWRLVSQGLSRDEAANYVSTGVALEMWRNGAGAGIVGTERRQYVDGVGRPTSEPHAKPGIWSSPGLDVAVVLSGVRAEVAELVVSFRPLISCVWLGSIVVFAGVFATATRFVALPPTSDTATAAV